LLFSPAHRSLGGALGAARVMADGLLEQRGPGIARRLALRERHVEGAMAGLYMLAAVALLLARPAPWRDATAALPLVATFALVARVRFQVGPGLVRPTQLVFVPMLFLLPAPAVPLLAAAASLLSELPEIVARRAHAERALVAVADCWYALGAALAVELLAPADAARSSWTVFILALVAQFATDFAASTTRERLGAGIRVRQLAPVLAIVYTGDMLLSPIGFLAVIASRVHPEAYLLAVAPGALLALIARERRSRIERELALGRAYRHSTRLLDRQAEELRREAGRLQSRAGRPRRHDAFAETMDRAGFERLVLTTAVEALRADCGRLGATGAEALAEGATEVMNPALRAAEAVLEAGPPARAVTVGGVNAMSMRLGADGRVLTLARAGEPFSPAERELLAHLAAQAAVQFENLHLRDLMREAEEELRAILEGVADGVTAEDPAGRLVYANSAAVRLLGDAGGLTFGDAAAGLRAADEHGEALAAERLPARRALAGEHPEPLLVAYRRPDTQEPRCSRVKATPVLDDGGDVRLAISVIEDITDIKQAEEAQRFLAHSSQLLAESLRIEETLPALARLAVPRMADGCIVHLCTERGLRPVASAHADPARQALAEALQREYPPDAAAAHGPAAVARTGESQLYPEISGDQMAAGARDTRHGELLRALGVGSAMVVPMRARNRVVGTISLLACESGRRFGRQDLALAEDLGLRAGVTVDNARLYHTREAIAKTLQASLLPPELPQIPGVEAAALYRAAGEGHEVGGDFYDIFSTGRREWFVVMGDVCGKGAAAAAVTALARYTIRAAVARRRSPAGILAALNEAMLRQRSDPTRFATITCARLDLDRDAVGLTVANGGHPCPRVLRATGLVEAVGAPGTALGITDRVRLQDRFTQLAGGDALVLYTDGLTEAGAPKRVWSPRQLDAAVGGARHQPARGIVDHLVRAALGDPPAPLRDDLALLVLRAR
jgi:PAS domain S-box-containing protein